MKIGNLDFGKYPLLLAPMEDVTDESFRLMCKEFGADMVYTEFVSSDALVRNINSTMRKLSIPGCGEACRHTDLRTFCRCDGRCGSSLRGG